MITPSDTHEMIGRAKKDITRWSTLVEWMEEEIERLDAEYWKAAILYRVQIAPFDFIYIDCKLEWGIIHTGRVMG